jgi:hypothetical protein
MRIVTRVIKNEEERIEIIKKTHENVTRYAHHRGYA